MICRKLKSINIFSKTVLYLTVFAQIWMICCVAKACSTCGLDYSTCSGYSGSGNCNSHYACECATVKVAYLDTLHPGFFTRQMDGKLVVTAVIPGSPAYSAGIRKNDIILKINQGWNAPCSAQEWLNGSNHFSKIVLQENGQVRTLKVALKPIREYLQTDKHLTPHFQRTADITSTTSTSNSPSAAFHALGR